MPAYVSSSARTWYPRPPRPPDPARTAAPTRNPTTIAIRPISYPVARRTPYQIAAPTSAAMAPKPAALPRRPTADPPLSEATYCSRQRGQTTFSPAVKYTSVIGWPQPAHVAAAGAAPGAAPDAGSAVSN